MNIIRSYKRSMAHARMDRDGFRKVNKHNRSDKKKGSYFANHWREHLPSYKTA